MKSLILSMALFIGFLAPIFAQKANQFNVEKFEKALIEQMEVTFPGLTLDTTLNFVTRARSAEEASFHESHASGKGGMVNTANDETEEAVRLVLAYKKHLEDVLHFDKAALKRCRFTEFCATATEQYGGLVRYGIVIDNNITRESYSQVVEEAIQEVTIEKRETSVDHLHLRSKVLSMIRDSKFDELLEIFNQKEFIKEGLSGCTKIIYRNGIWKGQKDAETPEEFLSFIKEIKSTLPNGIELIPTKVEDDGIDPWGNHQIFETYEYINIKGEKIKFYVGFINGQINSIGGRIYYKE